MELNFRKIKMACYTANISTSIVGNLPAILFLTFRNLYGVTYTMLGTLVLVNFCTQLIVDLIFSFFSQKFNIQNTVRLMPVLTFVGMLIFGLSPNIFSDNVYIGLLIGTVIFSASGGLSEVLISPIIAAIPAKDPDHEMSKLHSVYAWGVVGVVVLSTLFLLIAGNEAWQYLVLFFAINPVISFILFIKSEIPVMETPQRLTGVFAYFKDKWLWLYFFAIFLGGASECTMAQWSSGYIERALSIPKIWGDLFGVAMFSIMLGLGRTLYSKIGKHVEKVLFLGAIGAFICYLVTAVSNIAVIGLLACAFTGFCTSMLWPGCLIVASERFQKGGVFIYAMMAAGGDLGASIVPQVTGIITDKVIEVLKLSVNSFGPLIDYSFVAIEQTGMRVGMLFAMLFPLISIPLYFYIMKSSNKNSKEKRLEKIL